MLYVIALFVPSLSVEDAVTPTVVSAAAFSATVLAPPSVSEGAVTSNSSTSVSVTVNVVAPVLVSALVAVTCSVQELAVS